MTPDRKTYLLGLIKFPSLTINESMVVHGWLEKHADEYDDVDFNVRIGSSLQLGDGYSDTTREQAALLTQKRIDMVGYRGTTVTIVEVKIRVALSALGQLLGYEILWRTEHPETTSISLEAIGYDALLDVVDVLQAHGIHVELFANVALVKQPYG